ncbi:MAG: hypothetical protein LC652_14390 [Halomonas sp.]|nr:hypothetical protein [Halomonas sp.]
MTQNDIVQKLWNLCDLDAKAKAFRGELTAEWRAENPELISGENSAEVLMVRIKVEKAKQKPEKTRWASEKTRATT